MLPQKKLDEIIEKIDDAVNVREDFFVIKNQFETEILAQKRTINTLMFLLIALTFSIISFIILAALTQPQVSHVEQINQPTINQ